MLLTTSSCFKFVGSLQSKKFKFEKNKLQTLHNTSEKIETWITFVSMYFKGRNKSNGFLAQDDNLKLF